MAALTNSDYQHLRSALAAMPSDHDASGNNRPEPSEVFAPVQHANALDPNTVIVVGARGTGKSFWAGVLEQQDTRTVASQAYPHLGLGDLLVMPGYTGLEGDAVGPKTIDARVPDGDEERIAPDFWQAIIFRVVRKAIEPTAPNLTVKAIMEKYGDPEEITAELRRMDGELRKMARTLLITFDALDTVSRNWGRSTKLIDGLLETIWSLRTYKSIRAKIFIRPEQLNDENLRFIELPKMRSSAVQLEWSQSELYGLLFWRLLSSDNERAKKSLKQLASKVGAAVPSDVVANPRSWPLISNSIRQQAAIEVLAGPYMGRGSKKGGTYDWPYKHLADAKGKVTPRSFVKLFKEAATIDPPSNDSAISPEGIRHGLREASKVRVDQLGVEYPWIKRALAPLAGLMIPCDIEEVYERWRETNTVRLITKAASDPQTGFLPPFPIRSPRDSRDKDQNALLAEAMEKIGMIARRKDERVDIPDLFRVAAAMLKKGGTTPVAKR
jgi:hypothetical protein